MTTQYKWHATISLDKKDRQMFGLNDLRLYPKISISFHLHVDPLVTRDRKKNPLIFPT